MKVLVHLLLGLIVLVHAYASYGYRVDLDAVPPSYGVGALNRSCFPPGFIFGCASAAYTIEGGWNLDGKGPCNWDNFTHTHPEKIKDRKNGDVAADSYHRYKEDVELLKEMNADSYLFSISWSRVLPRGKLSGGINEKGIQYYNNLINELLANGLRPAVTLSQWDFPQALEEEYGGFLSEKVVKDFHDYADLCFKRFGDRVKFWVTLNEPWTYSSAGYDSGNFAPGRCSAWMNKNCTGGNSGTEPYIVAHNLLLAHADVVQLYRTKYQSLQRGKIGIKLLATWMEPVTDAPLDRNASKRALDFMVGWFLNPMVYGEYPHSMRALVGKRLPRFTSNQSQLLKGSYDFVGLNYYTAFYAGHLSTPPSKVNLSFNTDAHVNYTFTDLNGELIGEQGGYDWLHVYPQGIWKMLHYVKKKYKNPIIYVTENGINDVNNSELSPEVALNDTSRVEYHFKHLEFVKKAIENDVRVRGYFGYSLLDNFAWANGHTRFGLNYVDWNTLTRYPKLSAQWFKKFLQKENINLPRSIDKEKIYFSDI